MRNNFTEPEIIYEDEYLLVYNKPAGLSVQTAKVSERDLESIARAHVYDAVSIGDADPVDVHIVHRLDQPVSGLVVIAKGGKAAAALSKAFGGKTEGPENGGATKVYKVLVNGVLPNDAGELVDYLAKDGKTNTSRVVTEDNPGDIKASGAKKAILKYEFLEMVGDYSLYEITLQTGRHHQIRVQLSHAGCPIVGDYKYGFEGEADNLCLCAYKLEFPHPKKKGRIMKFEVQPDWLG